MAGERARRSPTRDDVARLAGVSTAVVSYVINAGPRPVADKTRERVLAAIEALDYRPNATARALKRGSTHLLGLLVSEIINPFHSECINALDVAATAKDYSILLASTHNDLAREVTLRQSLSDRGVDGLVFLSLFPDVDRAPAPRSTRGLPQVIFDRSSPVQGFSTVGAQAAEGARMITQHLIDHGHRDIAYIKGALHPVVADSRRAGWELALEVNGLNPGEPVVTEWTRDGGAHAVHRLWGGSRRPTAIFAGSDLMAIGALQALRERGLRPGKDVAVASFDGTAESNYSWPPLTTVRQPFEQMAQATIEVFESDASVPEAKIFPMELIIRSSCGCDADSIRGLE